MIKQENFSWFNAPWGSGKQSALYWELLIFVELLSEIKGHGSSGFWGVLHHRMVMPFAYFYFLYIGLAGLITGLIIL